MNEVETAGRWIAPPSVAPGRYACPGRCLQLRRSSAGNARDLEDHEQSGVPDSYGRAREELVVICCLTSSIVNIYPQSIGLSINWRGADNQAACSRLLRRSS